MYTDERRVQGVDHDQTVVGPSSYLRHEATVCRLGYICVENSRSDNCSAAVGSCMYRVSLTFSLYCIGLQTDSSGCYNCICRLCCVAYFRWMVSKSGVV
jgi:hypothetical protein